jgi:hypothetical protein
MCKIGQPYLSPDDEVAFYNQDVYSALDMSPKWQRSASTKKYVLQPESKKWMYDRHSGVDFAQHHTHVYCTRSKVWQEPFDKDSFSHSCYLDSYSKHDSHASNENPIRLPMKLSRMCPTDAASIGFGPPSTLDMTDSEHRTMPCHSRFLPSSRMPFEFLPYMPHTIGEEDDGFASIRVLE